MLYQKSQGNDQKDQEGLTRVKAINAVAWNGLARSLGLNRAAEAPCSEESAVGKVAGPQPVSHETECLFSSLCLHIS